MVDNTDVYFQVIQDNEKKAIRDLRLEHARIIYEWLAGIPDLVLVGSPETRRNILDKESKWYNNGYLQACNTITYREVPLKFCKFFDDSRVYLCFPYIRGGRQISASGCTIKELTVSLASALRRYERAVEKAARYNA